MYTVSLGFEQGRHADVYINMCMFDSVKELHNNIRKRDGDVDKGTIAQCSQPNVSFKMDGARRAIVIFEVVFTKTSFSKDVFYHEIYHAMSLYHRLLDAFGPFDDGQDYDQNNEEAVANLAGVLIPACMPEFNKMNKEAQNGRT